MDKKECLSVTIEKQLLKKFRLHCDKECKNYSKVVEKLIKEYMENESKRE